VRLEGEGEADARGEVIADRNRQRRDGDAGVDAKRFPRELCDRQAASFAAMLHARMEQVMKRTFGRMAAALLLAGCLALIQGCDATTSGARSQSPGPYPYNSPHG
jgi:hypothetical protein